MVEEDIKRFWDNVRIVEECGDECHEFMGKRNSNGYGYLYVDGRRWLAHRFAWMLAGFELTSGLVLRHAVCDNPPCVNVQHLKLGTQKENMADAKERGRLATGDRNGRRIYPERDGMRLHPEKRPRGERHGSHTHPESRPRGEQHRMAKLNSKQVLEIMTRAREGISRKQLAREFQISPPTIYDVLNGRTWRHLTRNTSCTKEKEI